MARLGEVLGGAGRRRLAARLRHRVTLQTPLTSPDGGGGTSIVWSDWASVWAAIEPLAGEERLAAGQIESAITHRVTIRYRAGVTAAMRVAFGARRLAVRAVIAPEERRERLVLLCEERPAP